MRACKLLTHDLNILHFSLSRSHVCTNEHTHTHTHGRLERTLHCDNATINLFSAVDAFNIEQTRLLCATFYVLHKITFLYKHFLA